MAIIDEVRGLNVQVIVHGQPLTEYDDDEESRDDAEGPRKSTTKYIEAVSDQEFTVRYTFDGTFAYKGNDLVVELQVDGIYMFSHVRYKAELQHHYTAEFDAHKYQQGKQWYSKKISFSKLSIVEEHTQKPTADIVSKLQQTGVISVRINRVTTHGATTSYGHEERKSNDLGQLSEKALKGRALSHAVGLRPPQATTKVPMILTTYIDPRDTPLLTYNFKYRSREALLGLHVIPREPTPIPLEERDESTLSLHELRELNRIRKEKLEAQKATLAAQKAMLAAQIKTEVKRERDAEDDDGEIEVGEARPVKKRIVDTIDLTDD